MASGVSNAWSRDGSATDHSIPRARRCGRSANAPRRRPSRGIASQPSALGVTCANGRHMRAQVFVIFSADRLENWGPMEPCDREGTYGWLPPPGRLRQSRRTDTLDRSRPGVRRPPEHAGHGRFKRRRPQRPHRPPAIPVITKPALSSATQPCSHSVAGSAPTNRKTLRIAASVSFPARWSSQRTPSRLAPAAPAAAQRQAQSRSLSSIFRSRRCDRSGSATCFRRAPAL